MNAEAMNYILSPIEFFCIYFLLFFVVKGFLSHVMNELKEKKQTPPVGVLCWLETP